VVTDPDNGLEVRLPARFLLELLAAWKNRAPTLPSTASLRAAVILCWPSIETLAAASRKSA
jgi:hypothetical protein